MEDSGELVTGAFNFGVPHPPGYPLWAFLGWVWRLLMPFGNPAWRICLMSVLTGALVVGVMTLLMTRSILMLLRSLSWADPIDEKSKRWIALTVGTSAALLFGFNRGVWLWACVPEMRVLNVFMFSLTAFTFFGWMLRPERHGFLYATILVYGLGISNHQTIVVMAVPFLAGVFALELLQGLDAKMFRKGSFQTLAELIIAVLLSAAVWSFVMAWVGMKQLREFIPVPILGTMDLNLVAWVFAIVGVFLLILGASEGWLSWRRVLICTAVFLIGVGFYAYMPIAAATNPPMNWGFTNTKEGFLHHITRGQYERLHLAVPLSHEFYIQIQLFIKALLQQFSPRFSPLHSEYDYLLGIPFALLGVGTLAFLILGWKSMRVRGQSWLIFTWAAFFTTGVGLLTIINPGLDKQQQEINIKFFAPAHGFFAMLIGYGLALALALVLVRWKALPRTALQVVCVALLALPLIPFQRNWPICEQRGHDFGYQFGYRMFYPGGGYLPMERDAVLFGGTDPGRFVPTYMIFCESAVPPSQKFHDPDFDPEGGAKFDRRDVIIITQNALADFTYMNYIRNHYDASRPDPSNPDTLRNRPPWQRWWIQRVWKALNRDKTYPVQPIWISTPEDSQRAFQEYVAEVQARQRRGEPLPADEQVDVQEGRVSVRGVGGVMKINGILCRQIFDHNKDKHAFYIEESYVIPWMYSYLEPYGIIMKINREPLPTPSQDPALWQRIIARDRAYWDKLCADFDARPEFHRDSDAQKTFSKLRSAIGGIYAAQRLHEAAMYAFQQSLRLCPESPEANFRLAQLCAEIGKFDDAITTLGDYQLRDPLNKKIGEALQRLRDLKQQGQQIQQLEQAVAAAPTNMPAVLQLAQAYGQLGRVDRAAPLLERAVAAMPRNAQLVMQLARMYGQLSRSDRIQPLCDGYLAQTNLPAGDMLMIAQAYLTANQIDKCISTIQFILQRYPQESSAYYGLARIRAAQGMSKDSLDALEMAIRLNPSYRDGARKEQWPDNVYRDPRFQALIAAPAGPLNAMP
jgi:tetratricopeptide (TPR) repeat protein